MRETTSARRSVGSEEGAVEEVVSVKVSEDRTGEDGTQARVEIRSAMLCRVGRKGSGGEKDPGKPRVIATNRRARFEFMPAGLDPASAVDGVDDLTDFAQALELRVLVTVERASRPGLRSSTWSQLRSSSAIIIPPANSGQPLPGQHWVPLGRDEAFERRLLAEVEQAVVAAAAK